MSYKQRLVPEIVPWLFLFVLTLVWGSSFILIKKGLEVFGASQVSAIRILSAAVFMVPFAISWIRRIEKRYYPLIFISGFIGSFIPALLFAVAQTQLASAVTGMINALTPVFVLLIGAIFYQQRITRAKLFGLFLAFSGTAILMYQGSGNGHQFNYYALFIMLATLLYGINVNILKFNLSELDPVAIASISLVMVGPLAAIQLFVFTDFISVFSQEPNALVALGYLCILGVVGTSLALMLFNKLIKMTSPLFASSVTYLIPLVAVGWGLIDSEKLQLAHYLGMLVIIAGVFMANKKR